MVPAIRRSCGPEPEAAGIEAKASAGRANIGTGFGADAITGGPEVVWSQTPTKWSNHFFENLFNNEWELEKSPAGAQQWRAKECGVPMFRTRSIRRKSACRRCSRPICH